MNQPVTILPGAGGLLDLGAPSGAPVSTGYSGANGASEEAGVFDVMIARAATERSVDSGKDVPHNGESLPSEAVSVAPDQSAAEINPADASADEKQGESAAVAGSAVVIPEMTPEQIGQYRKADISVAVGSALQQFRGAADSGSAAGLSAEAAALAVSAGASEGVSGAAASAQAVQTAQAAQRSEAVSGAAELSAEASRVGGDAVGRNGVVNPQTAAGVPVTEVVPAGAALSESAESEVAGVARQASPVASAAVDSPQARAAQAEVVAESGVNARADAGAVSAPVSGAVTPTGTSDPEYTADANGRKAGAGEGEEQPKVVQVNPSAGVERVATGASEVAKTVEPAVPSQSAGVLQAVAEKLKQQARPAAVDGERAVVQPINRETAQVVGEFRQESVRPGQASADLLAGTRGELSANAKAVDMLASAAAESGAQSKVDSSAADKTLAGFAETLAMANKSSRAVAETQQLSMPPGLKPGVPAWNQAVNDRVMLLSSQNGRFAEIQLDPPELGSLQVKLQVKNEQVSVVFATPHAVVKDALEQGMPRLREMFEAQGMSLADSSVEDQGREQQSGDQSEQGYSGSRVADSSAAGESEAVSVTDAEALSLVDYYA